MELPGVLEIARSVAAELGTDDVVTHFEGDIRTTDLRSEYSVVFAANLIHHLRPEELPPVFEKIHRCLTPDGTIAIWDIAEDREPDDLLSSLFSLFFHLTSAGRCHPQRNIQTALQEAGFVQFQDIRPKGPSLHTLFVARKPKA